MRCHLDAVLSTGQPRICYWALTYTHAGRTATVQRDANAQLQPEKEALPLALAKTIVINIVHGCMLPIQ